MLRVRRAYPTWGSKKILATLLRREPEGDCPARSTVDAILKRAGLVPPRKRRRTRHPSAPPHVDARAPNDVWTIDYKGWFRVGDGTRCDPLTINDAFSRASLVCRAMVAPKTDDVKKQLEDAFRRFGLPSAILSDNGTPFASAGICGLSRLSVWMLRLGVHSIRIEPGKPEQNGKHERFHETLKAETASPPRATIGAQQNAFTRFQAIYNEERPHEALDMKLPAEIYDFSPRQMPAKLPEHEYASDMELRRVRTDGSIKWAGKMLFVGEALEGEVVGLRQVDDEAWSLSLGPMRLATLHERSRVLVPTSPEEVSPMCRVAHGGGGGVREGLRYQVGRVCRRTGNWREVRRGCLTCPWGAVDAASPSGRDRIQPESLRRATAKEILMLIGQSLFVPGTGTPGVRYYAPWMPRQSDAFTAMIEVLKQSGTGWSLVLEVQTKNQEDPDSAATVLSSTLTVNATGTFSVTTSKAKELVRYCLVFTGTGTDRWVHLRMNPILWQPN